MRTYYKIAILFIVMIFTISFCLTRNPKTKKLFYNTGNTILEKVEIIKTGKPLTIPNNIAEGYHLWLKIKMTRNSFEQLISIVTNTPPISNISRNVLSIRGFGKEIEKPHDQNGTNLNNFGLPLLFSKSITFSSNAVRQLINNDYLINPQISPEQIDYQTQFYIKSDTKNNLVTLYIHLESNIKSEYCSRIFLLTLTYLKNNAAIESKTLPLFWY